jgi:hypothetical protein
MSVKVNLPNLPKKIKDLNFAHLSKNQIIVHGGSFYK